MGVQVSQIRYFASQPWPFPNSPWSPSTANGLVARSPQDGEIESAGVV